MRDKAALTRPDDKQAVVDILGSADLADEFLDLLPYSDIPGWWDCIEILEWLRAQGLLRP